MGGGGYQVLAPVEMFGISNKLYVDLRVSREHECPLITHITYIF